MNDSDRIYAAIDLKSFYASVECILRGLDALDTNLVVADKSRTSKTICLAVTPSLKSYGIPGRPRLFQVEQIISKINSSKTSDNSSYFYSELLKNPTYKVDYIVAPPNMKTYVEISKKINKIYQKYISSEDIHIYSVDEVFIDLTPYLNIYDVKPIELVELLMEDVYKETKITATAGIGTNLYLAKVAMDIMAKHSKPNKNGARIAYLDERLYKEKFWDYTPLSDFWRVGVRSANKLAKYDIYTMGDIARCSLGGSKDFYNEDLLFKIFGVGAEFLIDHAWGVEPCTIKDIKRYKPKSKSFGTSQVLPTPYTYDNAKLILKEMCESLLLDMITQSYKLKSVSILIDYDTSNITDDFDGETKVNYYGKLVPKPTRMTHSFDKYTDDISEIVYNAIKAYENNTKREYTIRRVSISFNDIKEYSNPNKSNQLSLFDNSKANEKKIIVKDKKDVQNALVNIRKRFGKNSILKASNLLEESTIRDRNAQIGGHKG